MTAPVLVIGGTRGAGLRIVERLRTLGRAVRVMARDPAEARPRMPAGVELVAGDLTRPETLEGARYPERAVNETLQRHHWDSATLRRELIGAGMMARDAGVYWRLPEAEWKGFAEARPE